MRHYNLAGLFRLAFMPIQRAVGLELRSSWGGYDQCLK
jgi:hypothetical protein